MRMNTGRRAKGRLPGFTLIELIIVITIIGVLAAVAMPRFVAMQRDARLAKVQAIYGVIKAAGILAKLRCELDIEQAVSGQCTSAAGQVLMDGTNIAMVNRYPAASALGIDLAAQLSVAEALTISGSNPRIFQINGATTPSTCQVTYTEAAAPGYGPTLMLYTAGC